MASQERFQNYRMRSPDQNHALVVAAIIAGAIALWALLLLVALKIAFGGGDGI